MIHIYIAISLLVAAAIVAYFGKRQSNKTGLYGLYVEATRPSELADGVPGYYGGQVQALPNQPQLIAPYSKQPCVWYEFKLEQQVTSRDANGASSTEWRSMSSEPPQGVVFELQSQAGAVYIQPSEADVVKPQQYQGLVEPQIMNETSQAGQLVNGALGIMNALSNNKLRVTERYIPIGQQLYVGGVNTNQNGQRTFANDQSYPLILTTQSKADLVKGGTRTSTVEYAVSGVLCLAAVLIFSLVKK